MGYTSLRRRWDSNPRGSCPPNTLARCRFRPLSHVSMGPPYPDAHREKATKSRFEHSGTKTIYYQNFPYFLGMPKSLQIFFARNSSISVCLGTDDVLLEIEFIYIEWRAPSRTRKHLNRSIWRIRSVSFISLSWQSYID